MHLHLCTPRMFHFPALQVHPPQGSETYGGCITKRLVCAVTPFFLHGTKSEALHRRCKASLFSTPFHLLLASYCSTPLHLLVRSRRALLDAPSAKRSLTAALVQEVQGSSEMHYHQQTSWAQTECTPLGCDALFTHCIFLHLRCIAGECAKQCKEGASDVKKKQSGRGIRSET